MNDKNAWQKVIILVDLNAFFASVEQLDYPHLKNKPVAVTNGINGSCIITSSYEAREYGIKTGMSLKEAKRLCPWLIQRPSRTTRYAEISSIIMRCLTNITPDIEIFSIDEAFLDVTNCQKLHGTPITIAKKIKNLIYQNTKLICSVGVSGDKTTAKYAAKLQKPNGLTIIHPSRSKYILSKIPVIELCGISTGISKFLAKHGVLLCGDMVNIPKRVLKNRFGPLGERIWYMAQALDPSPVDHKVNNKTPKSVGHGKVLPPNTTDKKIILNYFRYMADKVAARLRKYGLSAKNFYIAIKLNNNNNNSYYIAENMNLEYYSNDSLDIYNLCVLLLENYWQGQGVWHVQITAKMPRAITEQIDLFSNISQQKIAINKLIDNINLKYGYATLLAASLLENSAVRENLSVEVIAPAWRPSGIRNSINNVKKSD